MLLLLLGGARRSAAQQLPPLPRRPMVPVRNPRLAGLPDTLRLPVGSRLRAGAGGPADSLGRRFAEEQVRAGLLRYTRRGTIVGKALGALFRLGQQPPPDPTLDPVLLNRQFDQHNFKIVRRIRITSYDAFGFSLSDTTRRPRTLAERAGNALHRRTTPSRVRQLLLVRQGRPLLPQALAESERLLRQTGQIISARVAVDERTATRDSVDVLVSTIDVFSIEANYELRGDFGQAVVSLSDQNFLGLGHRVNNRYQYGRETPQSWGYEGTYQVPFREFFSAQGYYFNEWEEHSGGVSVQRDFYSPSARWAGALSVARLNRRSALPPDPALPDNQPLGEALRALTTQSLWVGRALRLRSYDLGYESPGRLVVAASLSRELYPKGIVSPFPNDRDRTLLLGTVGYSVRRYYQDRYLFGFGRTEDVPTGTLLSLTTGLETSAGLQPRRYLDLRVAAAGYSERQGYLFGSLDVGAFQRVRPEGNRWEQGLLQVQALYFTRRYRLGGYQARHLLGARATIGFNRNPSEVLFSGITSYPGGLRGFQPTGRLLPTSRVLASYEGTVFTPLSLAGFRMAVVAFADLAVVTERPGGGSPFGPGNAVYSGFGLGLRFRNELTVLRTFQFMLGYYPRGQSSANGLRLFESARTSYQFADFGLGQPGVGAYQ